MRIRIYDVNEHADCQLHFAFVVLSPADILAMQVGQFQTDREEQARCGFLLKLSREMSTADIVAMKVC